MRHVHDPALVRTFGVTLGASAFEPPSVRGWDVLAVASGSRAALRAGGRLFPLVRGTAVWVPDGEPFSFELRERGEIRVAYLRARRARRESRDACVLTVTPLLHELVERALAQGAFDARKAAERHLAFVLFDEVAALRPALLSLALPFSSAALSVAERLIADPALPAGTAELARDAACSARTLERAFAAEAGLGVAAWRRKLRLLHGLQVLGRGGTVTAASFEAGYGGVSAFIAAFRREFGASPGRFLKG